MNSDKKQISAPYRAERHIREAIFLLSLTRTITNKLMWDGLKLRKDFTLQEAVMQLRSVVYGRFTEVLERVLAALVTPFRIVNRRKGKEQIPTPITTFRNKAFIIAMQTFANAVRNRSEKTFLGRFVAEVEEQLLNPMNSVTLRKSVWEFRAALVAATAAVRPRRRRLFSTSSGGKGPFPDWMILFYQLPHSEKLLVGIAAAAVVGLLGSMLHEGYMSIRQWYSNTIQPALRKALSAVYGSWVGSFLAWVGYPLHWLLTSLADKLFPLFTALSKKLHTLLTELRTKLRVWWCSK